MIKEHHETPEEKSLWKLCDENWDNFSAAARTILREAEWVARMLWLEHESECVYDWQHEYASARQKMRSAAAELTDREHKILVKIWCAALAAAASIDPEDRETVTAWRKSRMDLHRYYMEFASMIDAILSEKRTAERIAEREARWEAEQQELEAAGIFTEEDLSNDLDI